VTRRPLAALVLAPLLVTPLLVSGCSGGGSDGPTLDPKAAASAPVPGVTLPPGALSDLVPAPDEVPAGMVPVVLGSGPRSLDVVAGYSGTGAVAARAAAALRTHGFQAAYVAQYANQATGQVLSVVVSRFATAAGAKADFRSDERDTHAAPLPEATVGEESAVTTQQVPGTVPSTLVLVRFRRGTDTWVLAYQAAPQADPHVAVAMAKALLARTAG
jgi:hypothetical protein